MKIIRANKTDIDKIIQLRHEVLHPGGPRDRVVYTQDLHEESIHLIVKTDDAEILAVGTLFFENEEEADQGASLESSQELRIRGMAVRESLRGKGVGSMILDEFIAYAKRKKLSKIWCNARERVLPLYERKGFVKDGESFDVTGSGPHYRMRLLL